MKTKNIISSLMFLISLILLTLNCANKTNMCQAKVGSNNDVCYEGKNLETGDCTTDHLPLLANEASFESGASCTETNRVSGSCTAVTVNSKSDITVYYYTDNGSTATSAEANCTSILSGTWNN